jgi:oligopeptidase A
MLIPLNFNIQTDKLVQQLSALLADNCEKINDLTKISTPSWKNFIEPLDDISDKLNQFWGPVSHLNAVANTEALRSAYNECLPLLSDYYTELGQNKALYQQYLTLKQGENFKILNPVQQRIIDLALRDFHLSGIDLTETNQQIFKKIAARLSELTTQFENNIIDATKSWTKQITDLAQLSGIPKDRLRAMQQAAEQQQLEGYLLTLDYPCYQDVITFADNAELREEMYRAFCTRASDQGPNANTFDNGPLMNEILQLREQLASLLGFENYAAMSLVSKMAKSADEVDHFLQNLVNNVKPQATQDLQELTAFSQQSALQSWDIAYYSEKLREQRYAISQETIKHYFPANHVLQGLFAIIKKLYGITLVEEKLSALWDDSVTFYQLINAEQDCIGGVYIDLYTRPNKRPGAWMDDAVCRRKLANDNIQLPIAFLNCNFAPATDENAALLTHTDVETLFHEMGHCLHHLLTQVDYLAVSGINNVPWDTVEFPSQFFESWVWQPEGLTLLSKHDETGKHLPDEMIEKIIAAKNFQAGLFLIRQLEFALFDIALHSQPKDSAVDVQTLLQEIRNSVAVIQPPAYNRFANSFSHIFAGGYAAGYYSYLWAEVLARDAFYAFIKNGLFDKKTGEHFKNTVLALGGSESPDIIFEKFMGRAPDNEALLASYGF